jgi:crossover junction endodeoxyribonuclease RusA
VVRRKPIFRIWVEGYPQSFRKKRKERYTEKIREAARAVVPFPTPSTRIDIEIYYHTKNGIRADVDNVIKPILDALIGIAYMDDSQVRSVKAVALPYNESYSISENEWISEKVMEKLFSDDPEYFMINIYAGLAIPGGPGL